MFLENNVLFFILQQRFKNMVEFFFLRLGPGGFFGGFRHLFAKLDLFRDQLGMLAERLPGRVEMGFCFRKTLHFFGVPEGTFDIDRLFKLVRGDVADHFDHRRIAVGNGFELVCNLLHLINGDTGDRAQEEQTNGDNATDLAADREKSRAVFPV